MRLLIFFSIRNICTFQRKNYQVIRKLFYREKQKGVQYEHKLNFEKQTKTNDFFPNAA